MPTGKYKVGIFRTWSANYPLAALQVRKSAGPQITNGPEDHQRNATDHHRPVGGFFGPISRLKNFGWFSANAFNKDRLGESDKEKAESLQEFSSSVYTLEPEEEFENPSLINDNHIKVDNPRQLFTE